MSALTKMFVVLLVVLSLLLSAASIVFVNTQTEFAKNAASSKKELDNLKLDNSRVNSQLALDMAQSAAAMANKDAQINQARNDLNASQQQIAQRDSQIAELTSNLANLAAGSTTTGDALKAAQTIIAERTKTYDELRVTFDKQQRELVDANLRVGDLTNISDVNNKSVRVLNEQVVQLQQDLSKANDVIRRNGLPPVTDTISSAINPAPSVNVTARVQETRMIDKVLYATINVGSADQIAKNMQLSIVDSRGNQFLGYIVIDTVEDHLAAGRIKGPGVERIQKGDLVRSQL